MTNKNNGSDKRVLLGILGERIIAKYLKNKNHDVEESLDMYNATRDMRVDGEDVEVKTLAPFYKYDAFSVNPSQLNKINNASAVYWINVPPKKIHDVMAGFIFKMDPKIAKHKLVTINTGKQYAMFSRNQPGMEVVSMIKNEKILKQLQQLSASYL